MIPPVNNCNKIFLTTSVMENPTHYPPMSKHLTPDVMMSWDTTCTMWEIEGPLTNQKLAWCCCSIYKHCLLNENDSTWSRAN